MIASHLVPAKALMMYKDTFQWAVNGALKELEKKKKERKKASKKGKKQLLKNFSLNCWILSREFHDLSS